MVEVEYGPEFATALQDQAMRDEVQQQQQSRSSRRESTASRNSSVVETVIDYDEPQQPEAREEQERERGLTGYDRTARLGTHLPSDEEIMNSPFFARSEYLLERQIRRAVNGQLNDQGMQFLRDYLGDDTYRVFVELPRVARAEGASSSHDQR